MNRDKEIAILLVLTSITSAVKDAHDKIEKLTDPTLAITSKMLNELRDDIEDIGFSLSVVGPHILDMMDQLRNGENTTGPIHTDN